MKVRVKEFAVDMEVKSRGIEFEVRSTDDVKQIGDCVLSKTGLVWCAGRTGQDNGIFVSWSDFIEICKSPDAVKAAVRAAKQV